MNLHFSLTKLGLAFVLLSSLAFGCGTDSGATSSGGRTSGASEGPPAGKYQCVYYSGGPTTPTSSMGDIYLYDDGTYKALGEKGRFSYGSQGDRIKWESGPLKAAVAHLKYNNENLATLQFPYDENEKAIDGHPIDLGPTTCYLQK